MSAQAAVVTLVRLDGHVDVLHSALNLPHCVGPLRVWVDTPLGHHPCHLCELLVVFPLPAPVLLCLLATALWLGSKRTVGVQATQGERETRGGRGAVLAVHPPKQCSLLSARVMQWKKTAAPTHASCAEHHGMRAQGVSSTHTHLKHNVPRNCPQTLSSGLLNLLPSPWKR